MNSAKPAEQTIPQRLRLNGWSIVWVGFLHVGVLLAPFTFSWSGLAVAVILYLLTGLGITLGYHRLLTHRSFQPPKAVEYVLAMFGILANQGSPLKWVAAHRRHHTFSDEELDPHTPQHGFWWAHMVWWMHQDSVLDDPKVGMKNVKDLQRDAFYRFFERWQLLPPVLLAGLLFGLGQLWDGVGLSWLIWGIFVRTVFVQHVTWFVNSATHVWGYRNFETKDHSTNLWWVALLSFGEGWHNNHHAHQRSARHGLRWWEIDMTYWMIRLLGVFGLARDIQVAPRPNAKPGAKASRWRVLFPAKDHEPARPEVQLVGDVQ